MCRSGLYKVPSEGGGGFSKFAGEDYQVVKRERENQDCGKELNVKKRKGKNYHLSYYIKAVGKKIKS